LISHSVDQADGRGRGRQEGEGIWATQEGRWETGEGRRVCQWGRVLLRWGMASCCHVGAVRRRLLLSFVEIQEVRRGGAGACRDITERQGRGVAEGPQQEAWGRGGVEARGAAIGHRRRIWLREIGRVRKVLGAAVEDFCGDFRPRREEEIQAGEERIFWYAKQKEARSHTRGLARHA